MAGRKSSSRLTPAGAERRARIVKMRNARMKWREIGEREGIHPSMAARIYREALAEIPAAAIDEHRAEELELIDTAINRLMAIALNAEVYDSGSLVVTPRTKVEAWTSIRGWAERKAKLLGLDAPQRHDITLDAINAEIAILQAELSVDVKEAA